ncbi:TonB-dependent receptor [Photobacterium marinum]|uniref:TonB-dependent receptor n=1 Tax=Photobacterium marinum TaxID=1056511 RepID=L8JD73_9GAMM|nr:TonB-dependent receptor [Photobacterium marinum]ELR66776.1 TonB-dependent receptor [Photobacterium marinum]
MPTRMTLLAASVVFALSSNAQASVEIDSPNSSPSDHDALEVMTVTATKMEENVRDIPVSVQVTTGEELEKKRIYSLEPFFKTLPNVAISNNYGVFSSPNYRGLATSAFAQESPITVYINGVPHSSVYGMDLGLLNVERVEFLRGSQSTLYGQSSLGGVINVITRQPDDMPEGKLVAEAAEYDGRMIYGSYGQALIEDVLSFNIAGRYRESSGYLTNKYPGSRSDYDESEAYQYNGNLRWNITDRTHAILSLNGEDRDNGGLPFYAENDGSLMTRQEIDAKNRVKVSDQALKIEHETDNFVTTYLAANQKTSADHVSDMDRTNGSTSPVIGNFDGAKFIDDSEVSTQTHELRFNSNNSDIRWVGGVFYQDHLYDAKDNGTVVPNSNFGHMEAHNMSDVSGEQFAIFGQSIFPVTDRLETTLGLRWQKDDKEIDSSNRSVMMGNDTTTNYKREASWDVWLPKLAFGYQLEGEHLLYGSVSKGYQAGGFNFTELNPNKAKYEPQRTIDYELGIKSSWLDNQLNFDLNLFYLDIKDAHGRSISALNNITFFNVDKARSYGAEFDLNWFINMDWSLSGALGLNKAEYRTNEFAGNRMANSPEFTSSLTLNYGGYEGLYGHLTYNYRSSTYTDAENTLKIDGYGLVDAHLGYRVDDYTVYVFGTNLFDEDYTTNYYALPFPGPAPIAGAGQPRTLGLGVSVDF